MAFHVTQCPGCDSTFNMNARILQSAAGKVRCGACLTVFEAVDNFIAINDAEEDEDSSVFVGNDPADYFDPTQFITRSALTAPDPTDAALTTTLASGTEDVASPAAPSVAQIVSVQKAEATLDDADFVPEVTTDNLSSEEADFLSAVAAELEAEPTANGLENEALPPAQAIDVTPPPYDEQEYLATESRALLQQEEQQEGQQEALEEPTPPSPAATAHPAVTQPETEQSTAMPTAAAHALTPQPAPEAIRLHASFSLYSAVSPATAPITPAQAETDDVATSAVVPEMDAAPDTDETAIEQANSNLADELETVVPEVVTDHSDALDVESTEGTAEELATRSDQPFSGMQAEAADFELIDVDTFDYVDPQLGDGFESDDDLEEAAIAQVDDSFAADDAMELSESRQREAKEIEAEADSDDSTHAIRARAFRAMLHDDNALEALPRESRAAIGKVLPPVELLSGVERQWGRRIALLLACLLLSAAMAAQFLWQRMPIYSRTADWRPVYEFACQIIACELPVYSEISALRSDNLVVRTHPTVANALTVSLSFRNTARFPQPFPVVILSFNSATNAIIALREFAPTEYLDVGLRDMSMMPVMTPVQIEIEVMDPGADAVNYTVAFRRP